jgi:hypothetical protein
MEQVAIDSTKMVFWGIVDIAMRKVGLSQSFRDIYTSYRLYISNFRVCIYCRLRIIMVVVQLRQVDAEVAAARRPSRSNNTTSIAHWLAASLQTLPNRAHVHAKVYELVLNAQFRCVPTPTIPVLCSYLITIHARLYAKSTTQLCQQLSSSRYNKHLT